MPISIHKHSSPENFTFLGHHNIMATDQTNTNTLIVPRTIDSTAKGTLANREQRMALSAEWMDIDKTHHFTADSWTGTGVNKADFLNSGEVYFFGTVVYINTQSSLGFQYNVKQTLAMHFTEAGTDSLEPYNFNAYSTIGYLHSNNSLTPGSGSGSIHLVDATQITFQPTGSGSASASSNFTHLYSYQENFVHLPPGNLNYRAIVFGIAINHNSSDGLDIDNNDRLTLRSNIVKYSEPFHINEYTG